LEAIFDDFAADDGQWVAIITCTGQQAFCAGHDLKQQAAGGGIELPPTGFAGLTARFDLSKPIIAAVNGVAMGGGFEIALSCDIVIASSNAVFALPEPRVGLAALGGGLQRLPRAIGMHRAMDIMLTGRRVSAAEGLALGFINTVVDFDVMDAALDRASDILSCSPMSIRATKEAVLRGLGVSVEQGIRSQWDYPATKAMRDSKDFRDGPVAFAEKRSPRWEGR
jgi:enoyl-CoA hydratase/carnithine racemase